MAGEKRRKQLARAKAERQEQRRLESARRARRNRIVGMAAAAVVMAAAIAWAVWPDSGTDPASAEASPEASATQSAPEEAATPGPVPTPAGVTCTEPGEPRTDGRTWKKPADQQLGPDATWVLNTNCGRITVALDTKSAPKNANGVAFLTNEGYYSGNFCHRLTTAGIFVLQCGSPGADGTGEVGFTLPDENLPAEGDNNYPAGTVAMANRGPDTASSQVFLVYKDTTLPAGYTVLGQVTEGLDVVKYVAAGGVEPGSSDATDGPPAQPIVIKTASIEN
ncbi:MAG: peptidylprolyl isomerase [Candidatus Nanopelagicales bacterium]|jgi:peptidyl-prolyl cis-trans isomerase B (cyclophilin B)|nr:peptidylprolyl isomerase [Candidatus Nanopelagicales bacterium]MCU0298306.1 peptidylprolyl isomerase [Candidatus Nanopelagicales bacterium]